MTHQSRRMRRIGLIILAFAFHLPEVSTVDVSGRQVVDIDSPTNGESISTSDTFLDLVQEVLTDASQPLYPTHHERNTNSKWWDRLKNVLKSSSAVSHSSWTPKDEVKVRPQIKQFSDSGDMFDSEMQEGARLISASLGLISDTVGLVADAVRVSGDTAAGVVGSSVKLIGTAVKSVSSSFEDAARILEPSEDTTERRKTLTSERLRGRELGKGKEEEEYTRVHRGGVLRNTRSAASQSVRLVGSLIRGVGDSLLLAGAATETIASSTTGVAEDLVRIFEDFAGSLSFAISPRRESPRVMKPNVKLDSIRQAEDEADTSYVTYGSYGVDERSGKTGSRSAGLRKKPLSDRDESDFVEMGLKALGEFVQFTLEDTQGIPSFTGELLGVMILCYLAALWTLSRSASPRQRRGRRHNEIIHMIVPMSDDHISVSSHDFSELTGHAEMVDNRAGDLRVVDKATQESLGRICGMFRLMFRIVVLPFKAVLFTLALARRVVFDRRTLLMALYGCGWLYLCRASQLRSQAIKRNAEVSGYRGAIQSIGSGSQSMAESAAWLNALLSQIWRVRYDPESEEGSRWADISREFPKFVRRAIRSSSYGLSDCRSCDVVTSDARYDRHMCLPYGGLEPYLSGKIGSLIIDSWGGSRVSMRSDVAYVSLYSITLGQKPPLLRSFEFRGASEDGKKLHFNLIVDAILEDLSVVLEVKLSSLQHALLPSTKVSINALDVTLPLRISVTARPDYPYISTLELSLSEAPECNARITPLSGQSGLRGVDVGSLPVIREWVRDTIRETLFDYVEPKYIAVDIASWLTSAPVSLRTGISNHPMADISQLRQKTREFMNPNPRTPSSEGVAIASVAQKLQSHRSVSSTAFVQDGTVKDMISSQASVLRDIQSLVRPTNDLSALAMDRWVTKLRETEVVEGNDEGGPLIGLLSKPLALRSPFLIEAAAGVFLDDIKQKE